MKPSIETILIGAAMTIGTVVFTALSTFDPETVTDLRAWAVGVAVASIRQVALFLLPYMRRPAVE